MCCKSLVNFSFIGTVLRYLQVSSIFMSTEGEKIKCLMQGKLFWYSFKANSSCYGRGWVFLVPLQRQDIITIIHIDGTEPYAWSLPFTCVTPHWSPRGLELFTSNRKGSFWGKIVVVHLQWHSLQGFAFLKFGCVGLFRDVVLMSPCNITTWYGTS